MTETTRQEYAVMRSMERMRKIRICDLHPEMSPAEFHLFRIILARPEGVTVSEITRLLGMPMPGVSRMLRMLESRGFIDRRIVPEDRRSILVSITPEGKESFTAFDDRIHGYFAELLEDIDPDQFDRMIDYWNQIMDRMEEVLEKHLKMMEEENQREDVQEIEILTGDSSS